MVRLSTEEDLQKERDKRRKIEEEREREREKKRQRKPFSSPSIEKPQKIDFVGNMRKIIITQKKKREKKIKIKNEEMKQIILFYFEMEENCE